MQGGRAQGESLIPDVQIIGISSRSAEKAQTVADEYGAEPFTAVIKLATDPRVEAISDTLDALNWLFGTPKTVFALGQRPLLSYCHGDHHV
ncbi:MAG: hypothetical protein H8D78_09880 [Chloroflexi bacterium]|nr:hypothetical protein [Chloroflexota bacterium]